MRILLINPVAQYLYKAAQDMSEFPSLGLAYLASPLIKAGFDVFYTSAIDPKKLKAKIKKINPHVAVIGDLYWRTYFAFMFPVMKQIAQDIKTILPKCLNIFTGSFTSCYPLETLNTQGIDAVIIGEGEDILLPLITALTNNRYKKPLNFVGGLIKKESSIIGKNNLCLVKDLNSLIFPARKIFDRQNIKSSHGRYLSGHVEQMLVSRGCPFSCNFCLTHTIYGHIRRTRNIDNVVEEICQLRKNNAVSYIIFWDDLFTFDENFTIELCQKIKKFKIKWSCNTRADFVNENLLKIMKESGCQSILYGVESSDEKSLASVSPSKSKNDFKQTTNTAFRLTNQAGISPVASLIVGFPDHSKKEIIADFNYAKSLHPARIYIRPALPIPGTKFYKKLLLDKIIEPWQNWQPEKLLTPPYGYPILSRHLTRIQLNNLLFKIKTDNPKYFK